MAVQPMENWMSKTTSSTYRLTLFATNKGFWNSPTGLLNATYQSGTGTVGGRGYTIIARSGVTTGYSIDNLIIKGITTGNGDNAYTASASIQFDLYEPFGNYLAERLAALGGARGLGHTTAVSCKFVLMIEFLGYDSFGKPVEYPGVFLIPMTVRDLTAKVNEEGTLYNFVCAGAARTAITNTTLPHDINFESEYKLQDYLNKLEVELNTSEREHQPNKDGNSDPLRKWEIDATELGAGLLQSTINYDSDNRHDGSGSSMNDHNKKSSTVHAGQQLTNHLKHFIENNVGQYQELVKALRKDDKNPYKPRIHVETLYALREQNPKDMTFAEPYKVILKLSMKYDTHIPPDTTSKHFFFIENPDITWNAVDKPKVYHYLFTGKNTEVLNVDLQLSNLFKMFEYQPFYEDLNKAVQHHANVDEKPPEPPNNAVPPGYTGESYPILYLEDIVINQNADHAMRVNAVQRELDNLPSSVQQQESKTTQTDLSARQAEAYRDSMLENITLQLGIVGDPFWLGLADTTLSQKSTNSVGNVQSKVGEVETYYTKTANGRGEASFVFINQRITEQVARPGKQFPPEIDLFTSGVYIVTEVTSRFQGGSFTQELEATKNLNVSPLALKLYGPSLLPK